MEIIMAGELLIKRRTSLSVTFLLRIMPSLL